MSSSIPRRFLSRRVFDFACALTDHLTCFVQATSNPLEYTCKTTTIKLETKPWLKIHFSRPDKGVFLTLGDRGGIYFERQGAFMQEKQLRQEEKRSLHEKPVKQGEDSKAIKDDADTREVLDWGEDGKPIYKVT